jgi:RNase P protein component
VAKTVNEIDRHRIKRTLTEVKRKFEEALALSEERQQKEPNGQPTTSHRHR